MCFTLFAFKMDYKQKILEEIQRLSDEIRKHDELYYNKSQPIISDHEYDLLRQKLLILEKTYPEFDKPNSPSHTVGPTKLAPFAKIEHKTPMLSLENAFNQQEMEDFIQKIQKYLNMPFAELTFCGEQKIDGLSASIIYKKGKLQIASTRGNGYIGENITENIKTIGNIPHTIKTDFDNDELEVRGEVYMPLSSFQDLNKQRKNDNEPLFSNPRNAASGSLRQLEASITASRNLKFFAYYMNPNNCRSQTDILATLKNLGFAVAKFTICKNLHQITQFYRDMINDRKNIDYEIDGAVFKINSLEYQARLGFVGRTPRHSIAFKFPEDEATTDIIDIEVNVGRSGTITPVAILKPINLGGAIISRATLHNFDEIQRLDLAIGDTVVLKRSGEVIPKITRVLTKNSKTSYEQPRTCPSCETKLCKEAGMVALYCPNHYTCPAQAVNYLAYFVSKNCFNIDGLGKKQIQKLYKDGVLKSPIDIFELYKYPLHMKSGFGSISARKLLDNIDNSKKISFDKLITSLAIPNIGEITAKLLADKFEQLDHLLSCSVEELLEIEGIGNTMALDICSFFKNSINLDFIKQLMTYIQVFHIKKKLKDVQTNNKFYGKTVMFTGKLISISRNEAKQQVLKYGAKIVSTISKNVDYLIVGEKPGSKLKTAKELGIEIITEKEWIEST